MKCIYCDRNILNKGSLVAHQNVCSKNVNKIKYNKSPNAGRKKGSIAWNKGKNYITLFGEKRAEEIKKKMSDSLKTVDSFWLKLSDEKKENFRKSHREAILKRYENGWLPKAGRCKKIKYKSKFAGEVLLDGNWELLFAIFLDKNNINWKRNKKRFLYKNENNESSFYTPDFFIDEYKIFIEIKGYETEKDRCKWRDFSEKLNIFKLKEIKKIKENQNFERILEESKSIRN